VRQNWQLTAQPTWLETQIVARLQAFSGELAPESLPSPASPPSPSGIHTVSTVSPPPHSTRYRSVPSTDRKTWAIRGRPTSQPSANL